MTGAQSCSGITSWKRHRSAKALCKKIDPFAKRAFQHASLKEACQHAPASPPLVSTPLASPGDLSAFQLFVSGAGSRLPTGINHFENCCEFWREY